MVPFIHLITQYCSHPLPARVTEYDHCVRRNLDNPFIKQFHNLADGRAAVPVEFSDHPKYVEFPLGHWLTYHDAIQYANKQFPGEVACLVNLDIFLDGVSSQWAQAEAAVKSSVVLCLSRTEIDDDGTTFMDPDLDPMAFATSQDAWMFLSPLEVPDCDFEIGTFGCDNAFAERVRRTQRLPLNAGSRFKVFHYDRCRKKTMANQQALRGIERPGVVEKFPEDQGQYLLPDFDRVKSVDALLKSLGADELLRYSVICDTFSRFYKVKNH